MNNTPPADASKELRKAKQKAWAEANREKLREYQRDYMKKRRAANPEATREAQKKYYQKNKAARIGYGKARYERVRGTVLRSKYGIDLEDYSSMLAAQNGACAICGTATPDGRGRFFHVDHCHRSGKVRGLLCTKCNQGIGMFKENPETLLAAIRYVKQHNGS
jgi:hypothetical protein